MSKISGTCSGVICSSYRLVGLVGEVNVNSVSSSGSNSIRSKCNRIRCGGGGGGGKTIRRNSSSWYVGTSGTLYGEFCLSYNKINQNSK